MGEEVKGRDTNRGYDTRLGEYWPGERVLCESNAEFNDGLFVCRTSDLNIIIRNKHFKTWRIFNCIVKFVTYIYTENDISIPRIFVSNSLFVVHVANNNNNIKDWEGTWNGGR